MRMLLRNVKTDHHPVNLAEVLNGAILYVKHLLREQQVCFEACGLQSAGEEAGWLVLGDAGQLQMAFTNVLRNAIQAVATQPLAQRQVRLLLERQGLLLRVQISDSGPGFAMDPSDDTLFHSTKPDGSGLGLFVVRTALSNHQGQLELGRSLSLGGAQVTLVLPSLADSPA